MRIVVLGLAGAGLLGALASAEARQCYRLVSEPAQYRTVEERVLVSPEREVPEYVPAVAREVEETVVVRPERQVAHFTPAVYGYEEQTILVSPAHREWRTRDEEGQTIGCWVAIPPAYERVSRRVVVQPAQETTETIPAETATRVRTEIVEPAYTAKRTIPATYATRERQELVSPATTRWAPIDEACDP